MAAPLYRPIAKMGISVHKRVLTAVTATGVAACLALAGCGGDKSQPKAKIPDEKASASASPSPTASTPTFKLPPDVKVTIDPDLTGDPVKDAILKDNGYLITALLEATAGDGPTESGFQRYVEGAAAIGHVRQLTEYKKKNRTITGPVRYYKRTVKLKDATHASLVYCEDQRKFYDRDLATGKILVTVTSDRDFIVHSTEVHKGEDGVWREADFYWSKGAAQCKVS